MSANKNANISLEDLTTQSREELDELFLNGETPSISEVNGPTNGRVLAGQWIFEHMQGRNALTHPGFFPLRYTDMGIRSVPT